MDEFLIISGKGGTGKTSITAAFAEMAANAVICDLDVDTPDLHLIVSPQKVETTAFMAGHRAVVNPDRCTHCGLCGEACQFSAITTGNHLPVIDPITCEGCKVCVTVCPDHAIDFNPKQSGNWYRSDTRFGDMFHAQLFPGEENSGKLVALLRQQARTHAHTTGASRILSDGPPGIGCPVISAMSGTTLAVVVIEPTPSGHHDMERVLDLCRHFDVPAAVVLNKADLSRSYADRIDRTCAQANVPVIGRIPFDHAFVQAMIQGKTILEFATGKTVDRLSESWYRALDLASAAQAPSQNRSAADSAPTHHPLGVIHVD